MLDEERVNAGERVARDARQQQAGDESGGIPGPPANDASSADDSGYTRAHVQGTIDGQILVREIRRDVHHLSRADRSKDETPR